jgi:hypothetical protein
VLHSVKLGGWCNAGEGTGRKIYNDGEKRRQSDVIEIVSRITSHVLFASQWVVEFASIQLVCGGGEEMRIFIDGSTQLLSISRQRCYPSVRHRD